MKLGWLILIGSVLATQSLAGEPVDYSRQIKPLLRARCYACHGVLKQKAGLRLDTATFAIKGGDGGAAVEPGDPAASPLIERISARHGAGRMPPEGEPLPAAQIALVESWIAQGARSPDDERPEQDPRDHWAFKTPKRPIVPHVNDSGWVRNPIDSFIAAGLEERSLIPQGTADKRTWLRRVSLDLIGLPPTPEELDAFVADTTPAAYDEAAERLLGSPHHGEHWGRHWMDVWRYSDCWGLGSEVRNSRKHLWHWRDWIVESLNADKGYDQMLREMLAADELYPDDLGRLRATGFLARQYFKFNRSSWLDEAVEHTSKAMLGLTVNCAKCHDHKFDPIAQVDYYRMRAIFEPYQVRTDLIPGDTDAEKDGIPRAFDCNLDAPTYLQVRGDERHPDTSRLIEPAVPAFLPTGGWVIEPVRLPAEAYQPGLRSGVAEGHLKAAGRRIEAARSAREAARKTLAEVERQEKRLNELPGHVTLVDAGQPGEGHAAAQDEAARARLGVVVAEKALATAEVQPAAIQARAAADRARTQEPSPGDVSELVDRAARAERVALAARADEDAARAELAFLVSAGDKKAEAEKVRSAARATAVEARRSIESPGGEYTSIPGALKAPESNIETEASRRKPFPKVSTGRRSALARWLTDPQHPLPARVAVNHIWSRHFGRPLVPTVFDFGRKGTPPTHPELLDWLAVELIESHWSMKHIHRLIVTSNTYRMRSTGAGAAPENRVSDPENRGYWRMNAVRMEAQTLRDSLLHLSGELDRTLGGPSIPVSDEASRRRSLYFVHSHNDHLKFLSTFDDASVLECYRRVDSIVPQQALALENSPLATTTAEKIGRRIVAASPTLTDDDFIQAAFRAVLAADPTAEEREACRVALSRWAEVGLRKGRADPALRARISLVHALLNHNDFITVR